MVLFGAIALSAVLELEGRGVAVVGTLPQGLPSLALPTVPLTDYLAMVLPAIGVLLVVFSEALASPMSSPRSTATRSIPTRS